MSSGEDKIRDKIKELEFEYARTQKNKATEFHLGLLKAKLSKLKRELLELSQGGGKKGGNGSASHEFAFLCSQCASSLVIFCRRCPCSAFSAQQVHDTFVHLISPHIVLSKSSVCLGFLQVVYERIDFVIYDIAIGSRPSSILLCSVYL